MDEEQKLNPLETVAAEMTQHSGMTEDEMRVALTGVLNHLQRRAQIALRAHPDSDDATRMANEYRAVSEVVNVFGTQLIAFEDIERHAAGIPN
jgi:hypothetical protein